MDAIVARQDNHHRSAYFSLSAGQYGASVDAYALTSNALVGLSTDATSQEKFGADRKITDKNDDA
ncbi:hypothetical protein BCC37_RS22320 [Escherichia coli]|nr:hypothetical protein [Escherichia coli]EFH0798422.1 hypothetical protein [Escherichia coli]EFI5826750.1 hypothetical protein [Escherichia coli]EFI6650430.1 hypothetical protein [Escherichia coli]EIZ7238587.1 hypothetical protein [Escherichia coli]